MNNYITRRNFLKYTATAGAGLSFLNLSDSWAFSSANEKVVLAVAGIRSRGAELAKKFTVIKNVEVKYLIDVDQTYFAEALKLVQVNQSKVPETIKDFRKALDDKDVDAIVIATPDHWHAPMAIEAIKAGKHVYVEKPCSYNPDEGEMIVKAAEKYNKLVQMGNQRRSMEDVKQMVNEISNGLIGRVYLAKCFYARKRNPIGFGKKIAVPDSLDWDLWQGPAPRTEYRDNIHPYNWHWFWNWGTGEALNNGVHMMDVARWAMNVDYPIKVSSMGGRLHYAGADDWQCPDTQDIQLEYDGSRMITWFGRSTNTFRENYRNSGILFFGTNGIVDYDGGTKYKVYDPDNELIKDVRGKDSEKVEQTNVKDPGLEDRHAENFIQSVRDREKLTSPIEIAHKSTLMGHLGNISLRAGRILNIDPKNGKIINDPEAMKFWKRTYEPGWQPSL